MTHRLALAYMLSVFAAIVEERPFMAAFRRVFECGFSR